MAQEVRQRGKQRSIQVYEDEIRKHFYLLKKALDLQSLEWNLKFESQHFRNTFPVRK